MRAYISCGTAHRCLCESANCPRLDLDDLDPDLELLALDAPSGASGPALVWNLAGHLGIRWSDRRLAPGPGEHALRVVYATRQPYAAAQARGRGRLAWTLPAGR